MHRERMRAWQLGCCACALLLVPTQLFAQDRVYPKQGVPASGKIVEITPTNVTIEVRGKNQNFAVSDIRKVAFDGEPNTLDRARESFLNGQYDQALEEIKRIDVAAISNPLIRQDIEFYRFYCEGKQGLGGTGDVNAAIRGLVALEKTNSKSHHMFAVSEILGELALAVGQPAQAARYFGRLLSAGDDETKARGVYRTAGVELSQDKVAEAKKRYSQLSAAPSKSPEMARLKSLAEVGLAVCANREGDSKGAIERLNKLTQKYDSTDQELFARIFNARGSCYASMGKPMEALLDYLKTDLLYFTEADAHAEALYHLKKLWPEVGEAARAADAGARLNARYASSSWAAKS